MFPTKQRFGFNNERIAISSFVRCTIIRRSDSRKVAPRRSPRHRVGRFIRKDEPQNGVCQSFHVGVQGPICRMSARPDTPFAGQDCRAGLFDEAATAI